jgi:hypothetical protein
MLKGMSSAWRAIAVPNAISHSVMRTDGRDTALQDLIEGSDF